MQKPQSHLPHNNISWPDLYFTAAASREHFDDVTVVTLKSYLAEKAYDVAIADVGVEDSEKLRTRVKKIVDSRYIHVTEHVKVSRDGIRVVIDCDVIDDDTVWEALNMLSKALEKLEGATGKIHFGPATTFTTSEITWLNLH